MDSPTRRQQTSPPVIIAAASLAVLIVTIVMLRAGVTTVFPHLYYIPVIYAAYIYQYRGVGVAGMLGIAYLLLLVLFGVPADGLFEGAVRTLIFVLIALVVAYQSFQIRESEDALVAYIREAALRLKNPLHLLEENLLDIRKQVHEEHAAREDIEAQLTIQATVARELKKNLTELDRGIAERHREIPEAFREYFSR